VMRMRSSAPALLAAIHLGVDSQRPMGRPLRSEPRAIIAAALARNVATPFTALRYDVPGRLATENNDHVRCSGMEEERRAPGGQPSARRSGHEAGPLGLVGGGSQVRQLQLYPRQQKRLLAPRRKSVRRNRVATDCGVAPPPRLPNCVHSGPTSSTASMCVC
jgi:hypothetical protein